MMKSRITLAVAAISVLAAGILSVTTAPAHGNIPCVSYATYLAVPLGATEDKVRRAFGRGVRVSATLVSLPDDIPAVRGSMARCYRECDSPAGNVYAEFNTRGRLVLAVWE